MAGERCNDVQLSYPSFSSTFQTNRGEVVIWWEMSKLARIPRANGSNDLDPTPRALGKRAARRFQTCCRCSAGAATVGRMDGCTTAIRSWLSARPLEREVPNLGAVLVWVCRVDDERDRCDGVATAMAAMGQKIFREGKQDGRWVIQVPRGLR